MGYGVSQSFPIIAQTYFAEPNSYLLIQQPEVHLHPRAQAALGTYFAETVAQSAKNIILETHSQFLIDRVRQEVASGTIHHRDVVILYFDKEGPESRVHAIEIDESGNLTSSPGNFGNFFLEEEMRLLMRG